MLDGKRNDPYGQFNFLIEIDGVGKGGFSEASGLTTDSNIIEYREGNGNADGQATTRFEYTVELIQELVGLAIPLGPETLERRRQTSRLRLCHLQQRDSGSQKPTSIQSYRPLSDDF